MKNILLFSFFIISPFYVFSQISSISGKVVIDNISEPIDLSTILITNETSQAKTTLNNLGIFTIKAKLNDALEFTSNFTEKRTIIVTESIIKKGFITVYLDLETIELAEANINPLKKNLKENMNYQQDPLGNLYKELGIDANLRFRKIDPTYTSQVGGGFGPISTLIGYLNGSTRKAKYTYKFFKDVDKRNKVEEYFTTDYFIDNLNIPSHKIDEFIAYCYDKKELNLKVLIVGNRYEEIEEVLEDEAPKYLALLNN